MTVPRCVEVINQDCERGLRNVMDETVDMVLTDPPFNIGEDYDVYHDKKSYDDYMAWSARWMGQAFRVLKPGGAFWLHIGDEYAADLKVLACRQMGFHLVSWVINYYTFGVNSPKKLTRSHAHFFYFTKGKKKRTFNAEAIKVPSARQLVYNDPRAKEGGRLPDDLWILRPQWAPNGFCSGEDTWYISRVCGTFKERMGTVNQLPERLVARPIRLCSNPGDLILDPFAGSATTLAVAKKLGRNALGFELSKAYAEIGKKRLAGIKEGDELLGPPAQGEEIASA